MTIQTSLSVEDQKFMALSGLRMWARAIVTQADRIDAAISDMRANLTDDERLPNFHESEHMLVLNAERHLFLIAAYKLIEHVSWATELNFLNTSHFSQVNSKRAVIKQMRDLNEHSLEYFKGGGLRRQEWTHTNAGGGSTDASATYGTLIGGRLDYKDTAAIADELLVALPKAYWPPSHHDPIARFVLSWNPLTTSPA